jgi:hypothetical protein
MLHENRLPKFAHFLGRHNLPAGGQSLLDLLLWNSPEMALRRHDANRHFLFFAASPPN